MSVCGVSFGYIVNFNNGGTQINQYELNTYNTDGTLASKHTGAGDIVSLSYDYLKRLNLKTLSTGGATDFTVTYAYTDWGTNNTTTLVSGMRYKDASGNTLRKFGYYYDALGNITIVFNADNAYEAEYTYDSQNQLATENLPLANIKYT